MASLLDFSFPEVPLRPVSEMGLPELERIRLILRGGSVIDWRRMHFSTREQVDHFLMLCGADPANPSDEAWVRTVLADAVEYLRKTFKYRVTQVVANPEYIQDIFLYASGAKDTRYRKIACIVLKVMHVLQHIEGRDLAFRLAVSEAQLSELVARKVMASLEPLTRDGGPVLQFADSTKTRDSLITKLIAKKETVAAQVYDKTRFRVVTRSHADILPVLHHLTETLFPFNFVVPGQTENTLLPFKQVLQDNPNLRRFEDELHLDVDYEDREQRAGNQFSGKGYRVLNFVADIPVRMDAFLPAPEQDRRERKGRVTFNLVEFQIVDEPTAMENETGENSHERYKRRQLLKVLHRLAKGLVRPKVEIA